MSVYVVCVYLCHVLLNGVEGCVLRGCVQVEGVVVVVEDCGLFEPWLWVLLCM